uniref:AccD n=1 Tax=Ludwigia adscendens TaxID=1241825 RepID=UPI0026E453E9|nr:AccD [Ludwigia adscendens]WJO89789.1 AccD [Ludwigia adscendens]WMY92928.1 acetyl-CoA carboxylase carboxyltransferase beta subunit [Ludwigia adscendens]WQH58930.1 acetyl-CoA carboxylase subunit beta [Ludwigia hexapetala]WQH59015.1 acetyl-CoA carboxylase subunit beta [Ludwigia hexapetala]
MEKWWFNSMLSKGKFEYRRGLSKSIDRLGPIENTRVSEDAVRNGTDKKIHSWSDSSSYSNVDPLRDVRDIRNLISDDTFLVRDSNSNRDIYSIYFDMQNQIFEIENDPSLLSELESWFLRYWNSSYLKNGSKNDDPQYDWYMSDTKSSWNIHINSCIDSYLRSQICIERPILSGSDNFSDSNTYSFINDESENSNEEGLFLFLSDSDIDDESENSNEEVFFLSDSDIDDESENSNEEGPGSDIDDESENSNEEGSSNIITDENTIDFNINENSTNLDWIKKYRQMWVQCENCYALNLKKFMKSKMNSCKQCGYYLKMTSSDRIDLLVDPGTWDPMDEDMVSLDPIEFHSEEEPYQDRIDSYQRKTGLADAVQTGTGRLNGIPIAIGVMDFEFMGGSMGSVVGEKITRLIEYATNQFLPLILVCASGGARMQEGSLSLIQMAKISSALYDYQSTKKLFYVSILTSPTTGGVTASFGMLGDIIIAEPNAYIAFAGKRVIEQTLNKTVPEGSQKTEYLFDKGLFDLIVPRNLLKGVLSELLKLHAFFPLNSIEP